MDLKKPSRSRNKTIIYTIKLKLLAENCSLFTCIRSGLFSYDATILVMLYICQIESSSHIKRNRKLEINILPTDSDSNFHLQYILHHRVITALFAIIPRSLNCTIAREKIGHTRENLRERICALGRKKAYLSRPRMSPPVMYWTGRTCICPGVSIAQ